MEIIKHAFTTGYCDATAIDGLVFLAIVLPALAVVAFLAGYFSE